MIRHVTFGYVISWWALVLRRCTSAYNVPQGVSYKLCLLVFKCLHGLAPHILPSCVYRTTGRWRHGKPQGQFWLSSVQWAQSVA